MAHSSPPKARSRLGSWIKQAYTKIREPIGYVLVGLALIGSLSSNSKLQFGALGILCGIILRLLFEIHGKADSASQPTKRVKSLADARSELEICLRESLKQNGFIRIQWMGMTMFNVWNTMESMFDWLAEDIRARQVRFEVAMLDSSWLDQHKINASWTGASADINADKIQLYTKGDPEKLQGLDWVFEVHRYAHMPTLHGGLINGKYLLMGVCRWEGRTLKAGDRPFEIYSFKDGDEALDKIKVFENWFNLCFGPKPEWYPQVSILKLGDNPKDAMVKT
jgi:hypothetical protein